MNRYDLDKKRLDPCVAEIYATAKGPSPDCCPQSYEMWKKYGVWAFYHDEGEKPVTVVPMDCYHIDSDEMKRIVEKWSKGLHGFWYYIPKLTHGEPDYDAHVKELDNFRKFESEVSKDKSLTYTQRAAKIKKEALAHNFMWRSRDKEYINFNVYLGVSPNSNWDWVEKNHMVYHAIETAANAGKLKNMYVDYAHSNQFPYTAGGITIRAQVEEVNYYYENDQLVREEVPGRELCNLYDNEGKYVDNLWNYEDIRRKMSAKTLEIMITKYKPVVIETLKAQGREDIVEWLAGDHYMDKDLKQCFAVWIMNQLYLAENKSYLI